MSISSRLAGFLCVVLTLVFSCSGDGKTGDGGKQATAFPNSIVDSELIALVNSQPIYGRDIRMFTLIYRPDMQDSLITPSFNERMLDGLIDRTLLWQEAGATGVAIDDSTRDWFVRQLMEASGGEAAMNQYLQTEGMSRSDLDALVMKDLMIRKFLETSVIQPFSVPDSLAMEFYQRNPDDFVAPDSCRARHIIIVASRTDTENDIENKKQTLRDLRERALAGEDFGELARRYSEGPSAPQGGDLGYFARRDMVSSFSDAAFSMEPGQISDVITTKYGYHIVQTVDKIPSRRLEYEEVEESLKDQIGQHLVGQTIQNHLQRSRAVAIIEKKY